MSDLQKSESEFSINEQQTPDLEFLKFFDPTTMSIHLKENQKPLGKKGMPGSFELVELDTKTLHRDYLEIITNQILSAIDDETLGNTEISKPGALVIQYRDYRIAITRPPFSELLEITIVHPIKQMSLEDYQLSEKLMSRLETQAEDGIRDVERSRGLGDVYKRQIKYSIIRSNKQQDISRIFKTSIQPSVLSYSRINLQVTWRLECFNNFSRTIKEICNS